MKLPHLHYYDFVFHVVSDSLGAYLLHFRYMKCLSVPDKNHYWIFFAIDLFIPTSTCCLPYLPSANQIASAFHRCLCLSMVAWIPWRRTFSLVSKLYGMFELLLLMVIINFAVKEPATPLHAPSPWDNNNDWTFLSRLTPAPYSSGYRTARDCLTVSISWFGVK